jgi:hypothetical protein
MDRRYRASVAVGSQIELRFSTQASIPRGAMWARITTPAGVNYELRPLVRMTFPRRLPQLSEATAPAGEWIFRSWVLLFGAIPVDRHRFRFESIHDGTGFVEESASWLNRRWRHVRTLTDGDAPGTCLVTDHLMIEPRFRGVAPLLKVGVRAVFRRRHRRLRSL